MSSSTWTPAALSSEARPLSGTCWRLVEAQHRVSTLKLVDTVEEQSLLEDLVQGTKPALPPECEHLHYLLSTPFRYGAVYPTGSRFRRAGLTEGVFYAAEEPRTAVAEIVFYRLLFYAESPGTPWPQNAAEYTAFSAAYATRRAVDLTIGKLQRDKALWMHLVDYEPCQRLGASAYLTKPISTSSSACLPAKPSRRRPRLTSCSMHSCNSRRIPTAGSRSPSLQTSTRGRARS